MRQKAISPKTATRRCTAYLELKAFGQWLMQRHALQLAAEDCAEAGIRAYERTDGYQREDD